MEAAYTYLLLAAAGGCAVGGLVGWWLRMQGEAARQHAVEVYYREALKISETSRDRAREEADQLGDRLRELREKHEASCHELEELRTFLEGVKQAGTDSTTRLRELEEKLAQMRARLKERESAVTRLQKEWKSREAQRAANNGRGEVDRLRAELKAMSEARSASDAESDRLRKHVQRLEEQLGAATSRRGDGNGSKVGSVEGNGAPTWLLPSANGEQDDLQSIHGLGPVLERGLNKLGVFHFRQVARMTSEDAEWFASRLNIFPGRILRDDWAGQAKQCHRRKYKQKI
jgi:predicted flap endonuclease-1-like 5' DNA nuclease